MHFQDAVKKTVKTFFGTFNTGDEDSVPRDHFIDSLNVEFSPGKVFTRRGSAVRKSFAGGLPRSSFYQFRAAGSPPIIFSSDGEHIYKNDTLVITIAGATSFAAAQLFGKLFISPRDEFGGVGKLYLYNSVTNEVRKAGGDTPVAATPIVAVDSAAGLVQVGDHKIAVAYETDTGFITPPGPLIATVFTPTTYTSPGSFKINLSNIPTGPAADKIVKRHILATKADENEYFFVGAVNGGEIPNNTATTAIIDFLDTDLVESADYLFDVLERPPAGVGMLVYNSRLAVFGFPDPDGSLLNASLAAEPETFDDTSCHVVISKDDGYNLQAAIVLRDVLYIGKEKGIYATNDNGSEPSEWDTFDIDDAVGAAVDGFAQVSPSKPQGKHNDITVLIYKSGAYLFDGVVRHPELTWKVSKIWDTLFNEETMSVVMDVIEKKIYITGVDSGILVGDYREGIDLEKIKWTIWKFSETIVFGGLLEPDTTGSAQYVFSTATTKQLLTLENNKHHDLTATAINSYCQLALVGDDDGGVNIFVGAQMKLVGDGNVIMSLKSIHNSGNDPAKDLVLSPITLQEFPTNYTTKYCNFMAEKASFKFECIDLDSWFDLCNIQVFYRPYFEARPQ